MKRFGILLVVVLISAGLWACSSSPQQLLETAQFEEKQHNREHAVKLYREIVSKHGGTPQAKTAEERLKVLQ